MAANTGEGQLQVFDLSNPAAPRQVSNTKLSVRANALAVDGNRAYVSDRTLAVVDLSDPAHPRQLLTYAVEGEALDVAAANGFLYGAADAGGLQVVQMGQPAPRELGTGYLPQAYRSLAVVGPHVYLASPFQDGVAVYDTSDLGEIRQFATLTTRARVTDMVARGDTIITLDPKGGLVIHGAVRR